MRSSPLSVTASERPHGPHFRQSRSSDEDASHGSQDTAVVHTKFALAAAVVYWWELSFGFDCDK
jgi:hypothetical protein